MKLPLLTCAIALAISAQAQTPQLVHDIVPGTGDSSSWPKQRISFNNKLFFPAETYAAGSQLWSYSGSGTPQMEFSQYGMNDLKLYPPNGVTWNIMAVMNNKLYFNGYHPSTGSEIWQYDGINAPTIAFDIVPGTTGSAPRDFTVIDNKLYFAALTSGSGVEFYVCDGIDPPVMHEISPGMPGSNPRGFTELNGKVYFSASEASVGSELFVYDPSTYQVSIAAEINPGPAGSTISKPMRMDNKLYFVANTQMYGYELYSFDGTTAVRLTDLTTGAGNGASIPVAVYNNELYFGGMTNGTDEQLYKYNATTNSTTLVNTVNTTGSGNISAAIVYAGKLYFFADDGTTGNELHVYDGTTTSLVADLNPGAGDSWNFFHYDPIIHNGRMYYAANDGNSGAELFSFTDPLSITNASLNGEITLSPNPTSGNATLLLSLKTSNELSITITDALGKLIWEKATTNYPSGNTNVELPVAEQAAGIFFYTVKDNNGKTMASGKLVKQ